MIHLVLSGLREAAPDLFDSITWKVFANSSEEVLSHDFGDLCRSHFDSNTRAALVFESEGRVNQTVALVVARKGRAMFRLHVEGRGAHAGGRHHHGANAIVQLARTVERIAALTDYARALTFNVGTVCGGKAMRRWIDGEWRRVCAYEFPFTGVRTRSDRCLPRAGRCWDGTFPNAQ